MRQQGLAQGSDAEATAEGLMSVPPEVRLYGVWLGQVDQTPHEAEPPDIGDL